MTKILVIEDDDDIRTLIKRVLGHEGHEVVEAKDGSIGIAAFRDSGPDLVISDIIMPNTDGLEAIEKILTLQPDAKIIAISGGGPLASSDFLAYAKKLGVLKTLAKPFTPPDLLKMVEEVL